MNAVMVKQMTVVGFLCAQIRMDLSFAAVIWDILEMAETVLVSVPFFVLLITPSIH